MGFHLLVAPLSVITGFPEIHTYSLRHLGDPVTTATSRRRDVPAGTRWWPVWAVVLVGAGGPETAVC